MIDEPELAERRAGGSLRDPSGYVFIRDGRVFRAVNEACFDTLTELFTTRLWAELQAEGLIVGTRPVQPTPAGLASSSDDRFPFLFEHDLIDPITFPYEWTTSMLADAGRLTLQLQSRLLDAGFSLKDASAYNIQFRDGQAILIDVASIERAAHRGVWFALGQFQRMFTFPLLLVARRHWDLRSYFLGFPDGMSEQRMASMWGPLERWTPELLLDVTLPGIMGRRAVVTSASAASEPTDDVRGQRYNLQRLERKLRALSIRGQRSSIWSTYRPGESYDGAESEKRTVVATWLGRYRPRRVLDIGCNTGEYSRLAVQEGSEVVSVDSDHDAVDVLYRSLRHEGARITPLVVDVVNPSPATGYMNCEHARFAGRCKSDCVLALALLHHLMSVGGLSLRAVRDLLAELTTDLLILEVIPRSDRMFARVMSQRRELHETVSVETVRAVFSESFDLLTEHRLLGNERSLLLLRIH